MSISSVIWGESQSFQEEALCLHHCPLFPRSCGFALWITPSPTPFPLWWFLLCLKMYSSPSLPQNKQKAILIRLSSRSTLLLPYFTSHPHHTHTPNLQEAANAQHFHLHSFPVLCNLGQHTPAFMQIRRPEGAFRTFPQKIRSKMTRNKQSA